VLRRETEEYSGDLYLHTNLASVKTGLSVSRIEIRKTFLHERIHISNKIITIKTLANYM